MPGSIGWIDLSLLAMAVVSAVAIGLTVGRKDRTADSYLFGGRDLPWWAILGSIVATETSAVTVLSATGIGHGPVGFRFLQLAMGLCLGKLVVALVLMPRFFDGRLVSAYEILERRFGKATRRIAGLMFLVARNLGDGLRLCLGSLVLQQLLGWPFAACVALSGMVTILYTCVGGMRSVVWNDCLQLLIYLAGGIATLVFLALEWPGGAGGLAGAMRESGKLRVFDFAWDLSNPCLFWAGLIGGAFLAMGTHGTDQMMVQRYLSTGSCRKASRALFWSGVVVAAQFALFLAIGVGIACHGARTGETPPSADQVYLHFIVHHFPHNSGLAGLMLAAILAATMSTLSSSLNSSAASLLNDFLRSSWEQEPDPEQVLGLTRGMVIGFGLLQILTGIWAGSWGNSILENALAISGFAFGILLGMFALALYVPRARAREALLAAAVGLVLLLGVQFVLPRWEVRIAWPWLPVLGSLATLGAGALLSRHAPPKQEPVS